MIVVVFCDGGEKYLSERFWDEERRVPSAGRRALMALHAARRASMTPSGGTAPRRIRTSAAARCIGRDGGSTATFALPNTTEEGPRRRFLVRPAGLPRGRTARVASAGASCSGSTTRIPDHPARPSQYDLDHAWPFFSYIIVSVRAGRRHEDMTSWRLREDRSAFDQEDSQTYA